MRPDTVGFHPIRTPLVGHDGDESGVGGNKRPQVRWDGIVPMEETVRARGHEHVTARHGSTFEVTTDDFLTPAGDCILGIEADRAPADFDPAFARACRDSAATIEATIATGEVTGTIIGRGHPDLTFASERSLVGRTSDYVDDRTVMVGADAAATDVDRAIVSALADDASITLTLRIVSADAL